MKSKEMTISQICGKIENEQIDIMCDIVEAKDKNDTELYNHLCDKLRVLKKACDTLNEYMRM